MPYNALTNQNQECTKVMHWLLVTQTDSSLKKHANSVSEPVSLSIKVKTSKKFFWDIWSQMNSAPWTATQTRTTSTEVFNSDDSLNKLPLYFKEMKTSQTGSFMQCKVAHTQLQIHTYTHLVWYLPLDALRGSPARIEPEMVSDPLFPLTRVCTHLRT